jgi:hypothetical protein
LFNDTLGFLGHRLASAERVNWRFVLALAGAALVLLSYFLPMFPSRITTATTEYSNSAVEAAFPVLIYREHLALRTPPLKEEFRDVRITVSPVEGLQASGWGWLVRTMTSGAWGRFFSYFLCLLLPILSVLLTLVFVALAWYGEGGLPEILIIPNIAVGILAPLALPLAWLHQLDRKSVV